MKKVLFALALIAGAPIIVQAAGTDPCTRNTPVGVGCSCNHGVFRSRDKVGPGWDFDGRHAVRVGWHATYLKGQHNAVCFRDR
jgi:hypothetical protein